MIRHYSRGLIRMDHMEVQCRITHTYVQGSAKRWALGCVNSPPAARESQEAGFTQPRVHSVAHPCTDMSKKLKDRLCDPVL